jgi:hypothetical protein
MKNRYQPWIGTKTLLCWSFSQNTLRTTLLWTKYENIDDCIRPYPGGFHGDTQKLVSAIDSRNSPGAICY